MIEGSRIAVVVPAFLGVVLGILLIALAAVGWFVRVTTTGTPTRAIPADMLFPLGALLVGAGALAWDLSPHTTPRARRAAELLVDVFPLAAVLACVVVALWRPSSDGGVTTAVLTLLVVILAQFVLIPFLDDNKWGATVQGMIMAAVLLLMPLVVPEASPTAGATGLLVGLVAGAALARR